MVKISEYDFLELLHFARRYCDGRMTSVPQVFNEIYDRLLHDNPELLKREQPDKAVENFPYATDPFDKQSAPAAAEEV